MGCVLAVLCYLAVRMATMRLFTDSPAVIVAAPFVPLLGGLAALAVHELTEWVLR